MATVNIYDMADTWNDGATTFTAIKMNVTDTASNALSLLIDLQVGGSSRFRVEKDGDVFIPQGRAFGAGGQNVYFGEATQGLYAPASASNGIGVQIRGDSAYGWSSSLTNNYTSFDTAIYRDAANTLALRNSTNAQAFNLYNTYTNASNYERGAIFWSSNVFTIDTQEAGTGSARGIQIGAAAAATIGLFGATPVAQQTTTGTTTGFTAGVGTAANDDSTYTGNSGTAAYTVGDIVLALKNLGILAAS